VTAAKPEPKPRGAWRWIRGPEWWIAIPATVKVLGVVGVVFVAGMTTWAALSSQFAMPRLLSQTTERVDTLEVRVDRMLRLAPMIESDHTRVELTMARLDSLNALARDTWCVVRAHALDLDPFRECTLTLRGNR